MPTWRALVRSVLGIRTKKTLDGRPLPTSVHGHTPVVVIHDRRLSAGVSSAPGGRSDARLFRIVVWRTYRDRTGQEKATTSLHRDELDPALRLVEQCAQRLPSV